MSLAPHKMCLLPVVPQAEKMAREANLYKKKSASWIDWEDASSHRFEPTPTALSDPFARLRRFSAHAWLW